MKHTSYTNLGAETLSEKNLNRG